MSREYNESERLDILRILPGYSRVKGDSVKFLRLHGQLYVKATCICGDPVDTLWGNFKKSLTRDRSSCTACAHAFRRGVVIATDADVVAELSLLPGFRRLSAITVERRKGRIRIRAICECKLPVNAPVGNLRMSLAKDFSGCKPCAASRRGQSIQWTRDEMLAELANHVAFKRLNKVFFTRDDAGPVVHAICECSGKVRARYPNLLHSLSKGFTSCPKCGALRESLRLTEADIRTYCANWGIADCFKGDVKISAREEGTYVEADCNIPHCTGHVSAYWSSIAASIRGNGTHGCARCCLMRRIEFGAQVQDVCALIEGSIAAGTADVLSVFLKDLPNGRRERAVGLRCLRAGCVRNGSPFTIQLGDLRKSLFKSETNGCPDCARAINGERHRTTLDELEKFIESSAAGPTVRLIRLLHEGGMGYAVVECLEPGCENVWTLQIGALKHRLPRGTNSCAKCSNSRGEGLTRGLLRTLNISSQVACDANLELWPSGRCYLDVVVNGVAVIEVHGIQHFEFVPFLHNYDVECFYRQQRRDAWKRRHLPPLGFAYLEVDMRDVATIADVANQLEQQSLRILATAVSDGVRATLGSIVAVAQRKAA